MTVGRPKKLDNGVTLNTYVPLELKESVQEAARERGITTSQYVRYALYLALDRDQKGDDYGEED